VPGWPLLAAAGGLLLALGGALALLRSRRWPTMSTRYETPAARDRPVRPQTDAARWDALDRGDDWTSADPPPDRAARTDPTGTVPDRAARTDPG
jgi:hypothetical protein